MVMEMGIDYMVLYEKEIEYEYIYEDEMMDIWMLVNQRNGCVGFMLWRWRLNMWRVMEMEVDYMMIMQMGFVYTMVMEMGIVNMMIMIIWYIVVTTM